MMFTDPVSYPPVPTIPIEDARPGDFVFCHSAGLVGATIRAVQRLRTPKAYCGNNHVAILTAVGEQPMVIQATAHGVLECPLDEVAPGGSYVIVPLSAFPTIDGKQISRSRVLAYANRQLGASYGFVEIGSILANQVTPRALDVRSHQGAALGRDGSLICSALAARGLEHGGGIVPVDPFQISPAEFGELAATTAAGGST